MSSDYQHYCLLSKFKDNINLFLMSQNPFAKFVVDPSKVPNPNTIALGDFEKYQSI